MKSVRESNGARFEALFCDTMKKYHYVLRLPTLSTGYAGMSQPADFIVVGDYFNYIELKETTSDRFSVSSMQQLKQIDNYERQKKRLCSRSFVKGKYYVVVHFMLNDIYLVVDSSYILALVSERKTLNMKDDNALIFTSLDDLCKELVL